MSRHFGESFDASQCGRMCDVCERLFPLPSETAPDGSAPSPPPLVVRDLSEVAIRLCEFVADANSVSKSGKKRKSKAAVGTMTQKQLTDECKKKNSTLGVPRDMSRDSCDRLVVELLLQGLLRETFKNTAYSTISYLQHDQALLAALRRGDLLIKIAFSDDKLSKPAVKTPRKRASKSATSAASSSSSSSAAAAATPADPALLESDGDGEQEWLPDSDPEPDVELDDDDERHNGAGALKEEADDSCNEDQPIARKRLKKGVKDEAVNLASQLSSSTSASIPTQPALHVESEDDFIPDDWI